jgi:hypothetical protein
MPRAESPLRRTRPLTARRACYSVPCEVRTQMKRGVLDAKEMEKQRLEVVPKSGKRGRYGGMVISSEKVVVRWRLVSERGTRSTPAADAWRFAFLGGQCDAEATQNQPAALALEVGPASHWISQWRGWQI